MTDEDMARRWIASNGEGYETEAAYLAAFAAVVRADAAGVARGAKEERTNAERLDGPLACDAALILAADHLRGKP